MILEHPILRTKALYKLERVFLEQDERNEIIEPNEIGNIANWIWKKERWHLYQRCPLIEVKPIKGLSHCVKRAKIVLRPSDSNMVVMIHELTHGKGYGSYKNPHSIGFVKQYYELLRKYTKFERDFLYSLFVKERLL